MKWERGPTLLYSVKLVWQCGEYTVNIKMLSVKQEGMCCSLLSTDFYTACLKCVYLGFYSCTEPFETVVEVLKKYWDCKMFHFELMLHY